MRVLYHYYYYYYYYDNVYYIHIYKFFEILPRCIRSLIWFSTPAESGWCSHTIAPFKVDRPRLGWALCVYWLLLLFSWSGPLWPTPPNKTEEEALLGCFFFFFLFSSSSFSSSRLTLYILLNPLVLHLLLFILHISLPLCYTRPRASYFIFLRRRRVVRPYILFPYGNAPKSCQFQIFLSGGTMATGGSLSKKYTNVYI